MFVLAWLSATCNVPLVCWCARQLANPDVTEVGRGTSHQMRHGRVAGGLGEKVGGSYRAFAAAIC